MVDILDASDYAEALEYLAVFAKGKTPKFKPREDADEGDDADDGDDDAAI